MYLARTNSKTFGNQEYILSIREIFSFVYAGIRIAGENRVL